MKILSNDMLNKILALYAVCANQETFVKMIMDFGETFHLSIREANLIYETLDKANKTWYTDVIIKNKGD